MSIKCEHVWCLSWIRERDTKAGVCGDGKSMCPYNKANNYYTKKDAPVNSDAQSAIQQGAVADLPAADIASVAYENALLVSNEFNFVCPGNYCIESFKAFCQKRLTELAGR